MSIFSPGLPAFGKELYFELFPFPKESFLELDSFRNPGVDVLLSCFSLGQLVCGKELFLELVTLPKESFLEPDSFRNLPVAVLLSCFSSVSLVCGQELFFELVTLPNPGGKCLLRSLPPGMKAGDEESFFKSVNGERKTKE